MAFSRFRKFLARDDKHSHDHGDDATNTDFGPTTATTRQSPPGQQVLALNRLNLQHFLWAKLFGYKLHPSIPTDGCMSIADVGTGTGVWMLDLSDDLPDSVQFHGFDTDLSQAPAPAFRPRNFHYEHLDIFKPLPEQLEGRFDVVHVRLFMYVIKNGNPKTIVKNVCKMLKPGGWLQWSEVDMTHREWVVTSEKGSCEALQLLNDTLHAFDRNFESKYWIFELDRYLSAADMVDILCDKRTVRDQLTEDKIKKWMHFRSQASFQTYGAVIEQLPSNSMKHDLRIVLEAGEQEVLNGDGAMADHITWVARKPLL